MFPTTMTRSRRGWQFSLPLCRRPFELVCIFQARERRVRERRKQERREELRQPRRELVLPNKPKLKIIISLSIVQSSNIYSLPNDYPSYQ